MRSHTLSPDWRARQVAGSEPQQNEIARAAVFLPSELPQTFVNPAAGSSPLFAELLRPTPNAKGAKLRSDLSGIGDCAGKALL
jgi:hypothetical protein